MGHSAGAQLAAILATDERFLKAEGLSLTILKGCKAEPSLAAANSDTRYQFEREGYFCADSVESQPGKLVFNRTIGLRDSFGK